MSDHLTPTPGGRGGSASPPPTSVVARRRLGPRTERVDPLAVDTLADDGLDLGDGEDTHDSFLGLVAEIRRRGWPVEVEQCWLDGEWVCYPGPARVGIGHSPRLDLDDENPLAKLGIEEPGPLRIHLSAPQTLRRNGPGELDMLVGADVGARAAVDELASSLRSARWAGLALLRDDAACSLCNDAYPSAHLLSPHQSASGVGVCPACIFDGDLVDIQPAYVAYQIDQLLLDDLAAPAGWAGVATLLAALGGDNFASGLAVEWENTGMVYLPMPFWDDAGDSWIWINADVGPLRALRPGTSTGRLAGLPASEANRLVELHGSETPKPDR